MSYSVTILLPSGHRQRVPVKLNTPILMILEETCKKHKLNPNEFNLTFHNRTLDLTSNIQFSAITNNAVLELTVASKSRTDTPVSIFLQLESGDRLSGSFLPSCSLWDIISKLCDEEMKSKINPVIIYTRQEVHGDKLKSTSLKMLGLTGGKALLRLLHRTEEQLKNQSVSSIYKLPPKPKTIQNDVTLNLSTPSRSTESEKSVSEDKLILSSLNSPMETETSSNNRIPPSIISDNIGNENTAGSAEIADKSTVSTIVLENTKDNFPSVSDAEKPNENHPPEDEKEKFNIDDVEFVGDRYALIFHVDSIPSPKFNLSEDDDFYELTVEDAKTLLRDIKRTRSELEEADLETSESKARKKSMILERTISIYPYCVVRIIFPKRIVLQGVFQSTDSILDVIQFTKKFIVDFILNFYLYISPPKRILKADETLLDIGAIPGINLYFGHDHTDFQGSQILNQQFLDKTVSSKIAFKVANYFRRASGMKQEKLKTPPISRTEDEKILPRSESRTKPPDHDSAPKKSSGGRVPKWFKSL